MAEFSALNSRVEVDGAVLSDHCVSINFAVTRAMGDATTFGNAYKRFIPGLKDISSLALKFNSDFDAGKVDDTVFTAWDAGDSVDVKLRPVDDTIAPGNPDYVITSYVENYTILNVTPGAVAQNDVSFKNAADTIQRNVAP